MEVKFNDNVSFKFIRYSDGDARFAINADKSHFYKNIANYNFIFCMSLDDLNHLQNILLKYINNEITFLNLGYGIELHYLKKIRSFKHLFMTVCNLTIKSTRNGIRFSINNIWDSLFNTVLNDDDIQKLYSFIKDVRIHIYENNEINPNELEL